MYFEDEEPDPFEAFGERAEPAEEVLADEEIAEEAREIPATDSRERVRGGFSLAGFVGGLAALGWVGAAIGGPVSYFGIEALSKMDPAVQAGMAALAFGPAILFWVSASAAGEASKARNLAAAFIRLTRETRLPAESDETGAHRLANTVKAEIESLNDSVASALERLAELEHSARRNAALFNETIAASQDSADAASEALQRERDAIVQLNSDMREDTEAMTLGVARQVRLMRETSKLVKTEMGAIEGALEQHLAAFAASATTLGQHTNAFHDAADGAHAATAALNGKVAGMLEGLSEATRLTDAARQSAQEAVRAANETAHAVRETTKGAVAEAKRAAQLIRAETATLHDVASETISKFAAAAEAARDASSESQSAAERHAASIEKRLHALAAAAGARKSERSERTAPPARAPASPLRWAAQPARKPEPAPQRAFKGFTTAWTSFLPTPPMRDEDIPEPANESSAHDLMDFGPSARDVGAELKYEAIDLIVEAGVDLDDVLGVRDLQRIAQSSRRGPAARRQAVADAAPRAVTRIARHVQRNRTAQNVAAQFRARPELAKADREDSEVVRAYLLIDAALA